MNIKILTFLICTFCCSCISTPKPPICLWCSPEECCRTDLCCYKDYKESLPPCSW